MKIKPYWTSSNIKEIGLTKSILSHPLYPTDKILEIKREVADKAVKEILKKDPEAEIVALIGSVAHGDILGWFSDIDMLVITKEPKDEETIEIGHEILFVEYYSWKSFEELLLDRIVRDEYEERSSYLFFYGKPRFLHSSTKAEKKYSQIVKSGVKELWKDYSEIDEYLDDFVWFYGSAIEALKYDKPLTAIGKLHRGTILLLRYYLAKNRILLRKPLPDQRTMFQLRSSQIPKELVDFIEQLCERNLGIETLLRYAKEMHLQITSNRKWLSKIPL